MKHLVDELTFRSYQANRDLGMAPERYASVVPINVDVYERRYQAEKKRESREPLVIHLEV